MYSRRKECTGQPAGKIIWANLTPFSLQDPAAAAERDLRELLGRHH
jgi:hypothetical protein